MLANTKKLNKEKVFEVLETFLSSVIGGGATVSIFIEETFCKS